LHAFPTRRSSDLGEGCRRGGSRAARSLPAGATPAAPARSRGTPLPDLARAAVDIHGPIPGHAILLVQSPLREAVVTAGRWTQDFDCQQQRLDLLPVKRARLRDRGVEDV